MRRPQYFLVRRCEADEEFRAWISPRFWLRRSHLRRPRGEGAGGAGRTQECFESADHLRRRSFVGPVPGLSVLRPGPAAGAGDGVHSETNITVESETSNFHR